MAFECRTGLGGARLGFQKTPWQGSKPKLMPKPYLNQRPLTLGPKPLTLNPKTLTPKPLKPYKPETLREP